MTINHDLHPHYNVERLYLPKKIGRCGILHEEDKRALEEYLKDYEEDALKLVYDECLLNPEETKLIKKSQMKNRKQTYNLLGLQ